MSLYFEERVRMEGPLLTTILPVTVLDREYFTGSQNSPLLGIKDLSEETTDGPELDSSIYLLIFCSSTELLVNDRRTFWLVFRVCMYPACSNVSRALWDSSNTFCTHCLKTFAGMHICAGISVSVNPKEEKEFANFSGKICVISFFNSCSTSDNRNSL